MNSTPRDQDFSFVPLHSYIFQHPPHPRIGRLSKCRLRNFAFSVRDCIDEAKVTALSSATHTKVHWKNSLTFPCITVRHWCFSPLKGSWHRSPHQLISAYENSSQCEIRASRCRHHREDMAHISTSLSRYEIAIGRTRSHRGNAEP